MELFDKDGNAVAGALSKEEAETAQAAAIEAAKTAAIDEYKAANPGETAEEKAAREAREKAAESEKTPAELAAEAATAAVDAAMRKRDMQEIARAYAPGDAAKQQEIIDNAGKVSGFESNADGLAKHMETAATMAGIDTKGVDISSLSYTGGGRDVDQKPNAPATEIDKGIQGALGIKPEDAAKYGDNA